MGYKNRSRYRTNLSQNIESYIVAHLFFAIGLLIGDMTLRPSIKMSFSLLIFLDYSIPCRCSQKKIELENLSVERRRLY